MGWLIFIAGALLYVPIGVALCRFWTWVDGPGSRHDYNVCILLWPLFGAFVLPILWLSGKVYEQYGEKLGAAWESVLRLAGWEGRD